MNIIFYLFDQKMYKIKQKQTIIQLQNSIFYIITAYTVLDIRKRSIKKDRPDMIDLIVFKTHMMRCDTNNNSRCHSCSYNMKS